MAMVRRTFWKMIQMVTVSLIHWKAQETVMVMASPTILTQIQITMVFRTLWKQALIQLTL